MTDTWPTMNKGRPADAGLWRQPPGQLPGQSAAPAASEPRPGDPVVVDATGVGVPVAPPVAAPTPRHCMQCGGEVDADGYCMSCGAKAPSERDHFEEAPASWVGAVCDRGVRHARNEDALAVAADEAPGSRAVLVVCDGVTTSDASDVAALAAARAARDVLDEGRPASMATPASRGAAVTALFARAAAVANDAVATNTAAGAVNPAACTFVAAVVIDSVVYAANVGDSRVYWLPDLGAGRILSTDDSLAEASIAGGVPRKDAEGAADAHTITRWLGVDSADVVPHVATMHVPGPGWVLVCSDGLWNDASDPAAMAAVLKDAVRAAQPLPGASSVVDAAARVVSVVPEADGLGAPVGAAVQPVGSQIGPFGMPDPVEAPPAKVVPAVPEAPATPTMQPVATPPADPAPVDVARALVNWAIAQGGHDNISACLARVGVQPEPAASKVPVDGEAVTSKIIPAGARR
jgi:serine/threonine protein phosphatase PrpC